jgi:hypothetical protein
MLSPQVVKPQCYLTTMLTLFSLRVLVADYMFCRNYDTTLNPSVLLAANYTMTHRFADIYDRIITCS